MHRILLAGSIMDALFISIYWFTSIFLNVMYWALKSAIHGSNRALNHPAIHIDCLAGNELGSVRRQKCHQIGDILRVAMMP